MGAARAGGGEPRAAGLRQGGECAGAAGLRARGGCAGAAGGRGRRRGGRAGRGADRAGLGLWPVAAAGVLLQRGAGRDLRQGAGPRHAAHRARRLHPSASPVAALPPGPADGRAFAGDRTRHAGHDLRAGLPAVQHHPHDLRDPAGLPDPVGDVRLQLHRGDPGDGRRLHRLDADVHRMAHPLPPGDERDGPGSQHPRGGQPAELRDGEVFRQRGA